jgi:TetR/AcrR family transcriptional regulator
MPIRDTGAEQLIKDTAKHIFFAEGRLHANTQDIADAAGVSRTLLNYYFRTKDVLIEQVFKEAMLALTTRLDAVMASDQPFKQKIENFIDLFLTESNTYPYQETFLITEINSNTCKYTAEVKPHHISMFLKQIEAEMEAGNIESMNPVHFVLNLFSLMSYPLIMSPIYRKAFDLNNESYASLMAERKKMICNMIFR